MLRCMGCMAEMDEGNQICPDCGYVRNTPPKEAYHMPPESIMQGRYIVGRVLGYGGFGVTYLGYDAQLERKVAIKEFLPSTFATRIPGFTEVTVYGGEATEQFQAGLDRFIQEAKCLATFIGIPGIVDIYDTFQENSTAYIVMEYLQGVDVKNLLTTEGPMPYDKAKDIIIRICDTLEAVHEAGIIHRDIAPDNIFINTNGEIKLLDFGASRYATSINSKSLSVILKAGYAPEEQYRSRGEQGPWSDVYALGATFYKMLTGITPQDAMERGIHDELKEPSKLGVNLPKGAENAIMNALNIRKENRTQTVTEFRNQLNSVEVSRVKISPKKSDTGQFSTLAKILVGGTISVVLLFSVLTITGVLDMGQGNLLKDTFGSSIPEGYVNAPGLVNLSEQEAEKAAGRAGLEYLIIGKEYSDKIEKGKILTQEPLPGRIIARGEKMQVTMSGGSKAEAIAAGEVEAPDVTYMNVTEAIYQMESAGVNYSTKYEFSDTVAEGLITRMEQDEAKQEEVLYISMGKNDESGYIRAPHLMLYEDKLLLQGAAATAKDYGDREDHILYCIRYSEDNGINWEFLLQRVGLEMTIGESEFSSEDGKYKITHINQYLVNVITMANEHLLGKELRLRVEQKNNPFKDSIGAPVTLEERIQINQDLPKVEISSLDLISWEEVDTKIKNGEINLEHKVASLTQNERIDYNVFLMKGNFEKGQTYNIMRGDFDATHRGMDVQCVKKGELIVLDYVRDRNVDELAMFFMIVQQNSPEMISKNTWNISVGKPFIFLYKEGKPFLNLLGMTEDEANKTFEEFIGQKQNTLVFETYNEQYAVGEVCNYSYLYGSEGPVLLLTINTGQKESR